ncbi:Exodeoxyribonuclease VIII-like protein [Enterobacter sp. FY-07]|uniref:RecE family exodeoxyribonuclease n=1 Tax=Kosakonia oryzendophytica TaxID=1005665 RepID=UPI00077802DD|nr:RecE family exodeoxyribonuclease [Kosakonia oryzendophytica]AMO49159.1 Exodeoxyribonuclease VIII-like protein [Enterobacter sp. FY-07]WBT56370.1 PD-(D/E)XK nuclease-like domain-containing protein [Kosakonia oryzendophytica]
MEFFHLIKASQKSGKPNGVFWFTAKTEARAKLQAHVVLEDNGIEVGRGHDYQLPVLTDFPVVNDLPQEEVIDFTWCDRYALADDGRTWLPVVTSTSKSDAENDGAGEIAGAIPEEIAAATAVVEKFREQDMPELLTVATLPFRQRVLAQFITEKEYAYHIDAEQKKTILTLEMDVDNNYVQNLLLAAENEPSLKDVKEYDVWKMTDAIKRVFPVDVKAPELGTLCHFIKIWRETPYVDRDLLVKEWVSGNRIASVQRTDTNTNAGGGNKTDRNPDLTHTLDTLDIEIALATLPMDFNIYDIPGSVFRRAKEIVSKKESPFREWSEALRKTAGILDYSRAAIFALIRGATENAHHFPVSLQTYINANLTESNHDAPTEKTLTAAGHAQDVSWENEINEQLAAKQNAATEQPEIANMGDGVFSIDGLVGKQSVTGLSLVDQARQSAAEEKLHQVITAGNTIDVQMEEIVTIEDENTDPQSANESTVDTGAPTTALTTHDIMASAAPVMAVAMAQHASADTVQADAQQDTEDEIPEYPAFFEPGRYEGLPNTVYHAANGISSTQVKDARVSLMYFNARHVAKTIAREQSKVLDMGNLVHALALQPENLLAEFSIEPEIPEGAFTTTATIRAFIDEYNAALPPQLSADDIKALLEAHNATLPAQLPLGASADETGQSYMNLPAEYQRIEEGQKQTAAAMKACIKEYNATLPTQIKTSGSRDALLEQLMIINPDLVAQEMQKPVALKVSGTKSDLIQSVKTVNPYAIFADELLAAWSENPENKVLVTRQQLATATAIQSALLAHPTAGKFLTHPSRAVEVSYFGFDDETGLEIRVRPDLEIDMGGIRIGVDLKTISMWNVKQSALRARLHREIIDRDYHLSAAMYMNTAALDQFFWIFVNKDEGYHWIAIVEASPDLIELGALEYQTTIRAIANAFDSGEWPAPVTDDYADELTDYDLRRLEVLRALANA